MEILFVNSYVRNKELAKEIYRYYHFQRKLLVVCHILILLSLIANLLGSIFDEKHNLEIIIFVLFYFFLRVFSYYNQVNAMVKRDNEMYGKEITVETIVTEEFIQNTASSGSVNKIEYGKIRSAVQTKNLILLRSKANLIYIFRKDTFTKGTAEMFIAFLMTKGIKVK